MVMAPSITPRAYSYIRFSRPEQALGNSLRRQLEASHAYAAACGFELDVDMRDLGLSAYRGTHRRDGALATFLASIRAGKIPSGSLLIVESLDRLSREDIVTALEQFLSILRAGIVVVTMLDRREYSAESVRKNWTELIISLAIMSRAHEESQTKSDRLRDAWEKKKKQASSAGMTTICPAWMTATREGRTVRYDLMPERAEVVRRIFDMTLRGLGKDKVSSVLNKEGVPPFATKGKPANGWHTSYIAKILGNIATYGDFQPHKDTRTDDGKRFRVPDGDPVPDYYPFVISRDVYSRARAATAGRTKAAGRKGMRFTNLLQSVAKCQCGGTMLYRNSGARRCGKRSEWLICERAHRKLGCDNTVHYDHEYVERTTLNWCMTFVLPAETAADDPGEAIASAIAAKQDERQRLEHRIESILRLGDLGSVAAETIRSMQSEIAAIDADLDGRAKDLVVARGMVAPRDHLAAIRAQYERMGQGSTPHVVYEARAEVAQGLRALITAMVCRADRTIGLNVLDGLVRLDIDLADRSGGWSNLRWDLARARKKHPKPVENRLTTM